MAHLCFFVGHHRCFVSLGVLLSLSQRRLTCDEYHGAVVVSQATCDCALSLERRGLGWGAGC